MMEVLGWFEEEDSEESLQTSSGESLQVSSQESLQVSYEESLQVSSQESLQTSSEVNFKSSTSFTKTQSAQSNIFLIKPLELVENRRKTMKISRTLIDVIYKCSP
jgi:hypothetical protein